MYLKTKVFFCRLTLFISKIRWITYMAESDFKEWSCKERGGKKFKPIGGKEQISPRLWYQRDTDQVIYSTVFRKLQRKSQLLPPLDPRRRTRLIHTLEVARIASEISAKLGLDDRLTEAISLAHDLANSPFGAVGNKVLKKLTQESGSTFTHEEAGMLMVQTLSAKVINGSDVPQVAKIIEDSAGVPEDAKWKFKESDIEISVSRRNGKYYQYLISPEVLDGVKNHNEGGKPQTLEGQVLKAADNFAYISQDIDDLIKTGLLDAQEYENNSGKNIEVNGKELNWTDINRFCVNVDVKNVFSRKSGDRIGTMIARYVQYNINRLKLREVEMCESKILKKEIPTLKIDPGLEHVINFIWTHITQDSYKKNHIFTSNKIQKVKLKQLFNILIEVGRNSLKNKNKSIEQFFESLKGTRFTNKSEEWKVAYLISHLSWDEVETITNSFHQRDYSFALDLGGDAIYPSQS